MAFSGAGGGKTAGRKRLAGRRLPPEAVA